METPKVITQIAMPPLLPQHSAGGASSAAPIAGRLLTKFPYHAAQPSGSSALTDKLASSC